MKPSQSHEPSKNRKLWIVRSEALRSPYFSTLAAGDFEIKCFNSAKAAQVGLRKEEPKVILVSIEFETLIRNLLETHRHIKLILLSDQDIQASMELLQSDSNLEHLVFDHGLESPFMQRNLLATCEKLVTDDYFGLEKHLDYGAEIVDTIISGNQSRANALEKLDANLLRAGMSAVFIRKAHHLADELLMNAIYDAPIDEASGKPRYNHLTRSVPVELEPSEFSRLRYGFDGSVLAISISDPFGALPRDVILKYLQSCFEGQFGKLNEKEGKGGGGMGLYQILSSADLFLANVVPGKQTEVIVLLNTHERLPLRTHSFHYFSHSDGMGKPFEILKPKARSLLLLSSNKRHQRSVKAVLGLSEVELLFHDDLEAIPQGLRPDILAIDDTVCEALSKLKTMADRAKCVAFSDRKVEKAFSDLRQYPALDQVFTLDLPKPVLHKLLLNHLKRLIANEGFGISSYLSFGAKAKKLEANTLDEVPRSDDRTSLKEIEKALSELVPVGNKSFAYDSHLTVLSQAWTESKTRNEWLEFFHPESSDAAIAKLYENAHALIFASNGQQNELTALRFVGAEDIPEGFFYTFFIDQESR